MPQARTFGVQLHPSACDCGACGAPTGSVKLAVNVDGQGGTIDGKPVWTAAEIEAHLNRTAYPGTDVPGAGWSNEGYDARPASGDPALLRFGFHTAATIAASAYDGTTEGLGFQPFTAAQEAAARKAVVLWDDVVAIGIVETSADQADITFGSYDNQPNSQAYAYLPYNYSAPDTELAGDVWVNAEQASNFELGNGDYGLLTLVHETGHALGLMHPGDYDASSGETINYTDHAEYYQDSRQYTVMSYFNSELTGAGHVDWSRLVWVYGQTPLLHDILAIQAIYGADPTTRAGGTVYGFNATAGRDVFDFVLNTLPVISIYDAGGIDTLDFSGWDSPSTIDLNPGAFSSGGGSGVVPLEDLKAAGLLPPDYTQAQYDALRAAYNSPDGLLHDNISIAYGTIIENAIGGGGGDTIVGNAAGNVLIGGGGDDVLRGAEADDELTGAEGDDVLEGGSGLDRLYGGTGSDTLRGGDGGDMLDGGADADTLDGGPGSDTMRGGGGNDTYVVDQSGDDVVEASDAGSDWVRSSVGYVLPQHVENLALTGAGIINGTGNALANVISGNAKANVLNGAGGADTMRGGKGHDIYIVDDAGDQVIEQADEGSDIVRSYVTYTLPDHVENLSLGGAGVINGTGNALANRLYGNAKANVLDGSAGADTMVGRAGHDIYYVDNAHENVIEAAGEGTDTVRSSVTYSLVLNVENLVLIGTAAINGTGNHLGNQLIGNASANVLDGARGADLMRGRAGNDTYFVDHAGDNVVELAGEGIDRVRSSVSYSLSQHVENLILEGSAAINGTGNALANQLVGNRGSNLLDGLGGADVMRGRAGSDTYVVDHAGDQVIELAGEGADRVRSSISYTLGDNVENLYLSGAEAISGTGNALANRIVGNRAANLLKGEAGNDTLSGGGGNDKLFGGTGRDVLQGGDGLDRFYFDTALGTSNVDRILDLTPGVDKVLLDDAIFRGLSAGALPASAFAVGSAAATAAHRILYDSAKRALLYDADGAGGGAAVQFAALANDLPTLTASDFLVI